jgi:hypothetical protein
MIDRSIGCRWVTGSDLCKGDQRAKSFVDSQKQDLGVTRLCDSYVL